MVLIRHPLYCVLLHLPFTALLPPPGASLPQSVASSIITCRSRSDIIPTKGSICSIALITASSSPHIFHQVCPNLRRKKVMYMPISKTSINVQHIFGDICHSGWHGALCRFLWQLAPLSCLCRHKHIPVVCNVDGFQGLSNTPFARGTWGTLGTW